MAELIQIHPENPQEKYVAQAVSVLERGGLVIFPTDTVYAIGADIRQPKALERLAKIKGAPLDKVDLSFMFHNLSRLSDYTRQFDTSVYKILKHNLPGPFTFILEAGSVIPKLFKNKKKTIGIRVPDNKVALLLAAGLNSPIATTSVHDDDEVLEYTTDPELICEKYDAAVDLVIDSGYGDNVASTIVDLTQDEPVVLRYGKGDPGNL